jgi:hypothetical protein
MLAEIAAAFFLFLMFIGLCILIGIVAWSNGL